MMKRKLPFVYLLLLALFSIQGLYKPDNSSNPNIANSGAPGDGNCSNCHSQSTGGVEGSMSITGFPSSIVPGNSYPITVTLTYSAGKPSTNAKVGFQALTLNSSNTNSGSYNNLGTNVGTEGTTKIYVEHNTAKTVAVGVNSASYTYNWVAPPSASGTITMYASGILTNGNGNNAGDRWVSTSASGVAATANLSVTLAPTQPTCNLSNGSIVATPTGGTSYTYAWSNGGNTQTISNLAPGTYTVTATSGALTGTSSVSLVNQGTMSVNVAPNNPVLNCSSPSTTLTATPSSTATYLWSNGATTSAITVSPAATTVYTVTATGTNGCISTKSNTVTVNNTPPTVTITPAAPTVTCTTTSALLSATGGGTYLWSTGATTSSITVSPTVSTNYTVTVTNASGCTATLSRQVVANNTPPTGPIAASFNPVTCTNPSAVLTAPAGNTYSWNTGVTTSSITVTPIVPTAYSVVVTGANGCTLNTNVTVQVNKTAPTVTISSTGTSLSCLTPSATLIPNGGTGATYVWNTGQTTGPISVTPLVTTTYTVTATATNGCTGTKTIAISVNKNPPTVNINPANPTTNCTSTTATITATGGGTYLWSTGQTTAAITQAAGTYTVTVTSANGCTNTASRTIVSDGGITPVTISPNSVTLDCNSTAAAVFQASGTGNTYFWSNGATTSSITTTVVGVYTVTATQANGCTSTATAIVLNDFTAPGASISGNTVLNCINPSTILTASGNGSYMWSNGQTSASNSITSPGVYTVTVTGSNGCSSTASVAVTADNGVTNAQITGNTLLNCTTTSTILTASGGGTYLWNNNSTAAQITVTTAGPYTVTVTSPNGCTAIASATVTQDATAPSASISSNINELTCVNPVATLTATGGGTYSWGNGAVSQSITVTAGGTYVCTVTGANGCSAVVDYTLLQNQTAPNVQLSASVNPLTCSQPTSVLSVTPSAGSTFLWSGGVLPGASGTGTVSAAGVYTVTITNSTNGCTATANVVVQGNQVGPNAQVNASSSELTCANPIVQLSSGNGVAYIWSNGATSSIQTITAAGTYTVTITDSNGCTGTSSVAVVSNTTLPTCTITPANPVVNCAGPAVLTANSSTAISYLWSNGATTQVQSVTAAGTYTVTATGANGCTRSSSRVVTADFTLPTATISPSNALAVLPCNGAGLLLSSSNAAAGGSYLWSNGVTTQTNLVTVAGTYTVTITRSNGCTKSSSRTVSNAPILTTLITASDPGISCATPSGTVALTASPGTTFMWSNGSTTATINVPAGTYTVTATNANGCSDTSVRTVANITTPAPYSLTGTQLCAPNRIQLNWTGPASGSVYSVRWRSFTAGTWSAYSSYVTAGQVTTYTTPTLLPSTKYQFNLRYRCPNNGPFSATRSLTQVTTNCASDNGSNALVLDNEAASEKANVFPNPSKGQITVQLPNGVEEGTLKVMFADGREAGTFDLNGQETLVDLSQLPAGAYMSVLQYGNQKQLLRLILE